MNNKWHILRKATGITAIAILFLANGSGTVTLTCSTGIVCDLLNVSIFEFPDPVTSGDTSLVVVKVTRPCGTIPGELCPAIYPPPIIPVANATIHLNATGGNLSPADGMTNETGYFTSNYTAPIVTTSKLYTISATASKRIFPNYIINGSGSDIIIVTEGIRGDMNCNGRIDTGDATLILRDVVGLYIPRCWAQ